MTLTSHPSTDSCLLQLSANPCIGLMTQWSHPFSDSCLLQLSANPCISRMTLTSDWSHPFTDSCLLQLSANLCISCWLHQSTDPIRLLTAASCNCQPIRGSVADSISQLIPSTLVSAADSISQHMRHICWVAFIKQGKYHAIISSVSLSHVISRSSPSYIWFCKLTDSGLMQLSAILCISQMTPSFIWSHLTADSCLLQLSAILCIRRMTSSFNRPQIIANSCLLQQSAILCISRMIPSSDLPHPFLAILCISRIIPSSHWSYPFADTSL